MKQALQLVRSSNAICVLTGAGISAESGVPTFRGQDGLWQGHRAVELATPEAFDRDPKTVWQFYNWRRDLLRNCQPNDGHCALAELERRCASFALVTQNVDGLHQRAGSRNVIELHGNVWIDRCENCGRQKDGCDRPDADDPRCDACGGRLRPGVVWFGESLPPDAIDAAWAAAQACQLMIVVGTSAVVQPAASLPLLVKQQGSPVIEINPEPTPITDLCDVSLRASAGETLQTLIRDA